MINEPKDETFRDLVKQMRLKQIMYFKTRIGSDLAAAKKLEKEVDYHLGITEKPKTQPPTLF